MTGRYTPLRHVKAMLECQGGKCSQCPAVLILGPKGQRVNFIVEHRQALGRGGNNALANKDLRCHACAKAKTFHPRSLASTIGSDIFEIAKTKALKRKGVHRVRKRRRVKISAPTGWAKKLTQKSRWPSRKIESRPFPKRISR